MVSLKSVCQTNLNHMAVLKILVMNVKVPSMPGTCEPRETTFSIFFFTHFY